LSEQTSDAPISVGPQPEIEEDLRALQQLLPGLLRALRHGGPSLREVEPLKRAFFEAGLRERHGRLLLTLASSGPLTIGALAARVALAPATTSLLAGELNRAGFLDRHEDNDDRRRTIVSLPDQIRPALEQFARLRLQPLRRTLEQMTPAAREHFIEGLRILNTEAGADDKP
jgi:DNA-binding MarR family transcriptional regulator